ncbi:MAG: hypothetical protein Q9217_001957 [Psora testacea]
MKLRSLKSRLKRSKWTPIYWQTPEPLELRRHHQNLSNATICHTRNAQSLLLRALPFEIRLRIYEYVFSHPPLRYPLADSDQNAQVRGLLDASHFPINCIWRGRLPGRLIAQPPIQLNDQADFSFGSQQNYAPHRLAILKTCKQTYAEAVDLFYSQPTFLVQDTPVLFDLFSTLLPQRLASIRNLQLHFLLRWPDIPSWWANPKSSPDNAVLWSSIWESIAQKMTGLQDLTLYIRQFTWSPKPNAETERRVLAPLMLLRSLKSFKLWYRHERVFDPFGYKYENIYTFDLLGEECVENDVVEFRKLLKNIVMMPKEERDE